MSFPSISRRVTAVAIAATAGIGIGVGAAGARFASGGDAPQVFHTQPAAATEPATATTTPPPSPPSSPLTAAQAQAVAIQASPGTVVDLDQDDDVTGLVYEVKIQHADGTQTEVEVDATTGQVVPEQKHDPADRD